MQEGLSFLILGFLGFFVFGLEEKQKHTLTKSVAEYYVPGAILICSSKNTMCSNVGPPLSWFLIAYSYSQGITQFPQMNSVEK